TGRFLPPLFGRAARGRCGVPGRPFRAALSTLPRCRLRAGRRQRRDPARLRARPLLVGRVRGEVRLRRPRPVPPQRHVDGAVPPGGTALPPGGGVIGVLGGGRAFVRAPESRYRALRAGRFGTAPGDGRCGLLRHGLRRLRGWGRGGGGGSRGRRRGGGGGGR